MAVLYVIATFARTIEGEKALDLLKGKAWQNVNTAPRGLTRWCGSSHTRRSMVRLG